jgi:hypothetical protein
MAAQIPAGETAILFRGLNYKIWCVRYDQTVTTFTVNQSTQGIFVIEPTSSAPTVSLGTASGGVKTATIAAGGSASSNGTVTLVTVHGASLGSGAG